MTATILTHKEMTAHIRKRIKVSGIKARVRMADFCGHAMVQVFPTTYEARFSDDEQRAILEIMVANRFTLIRGMPIVVDQMTYGPGGNFEMPY